MKKNSLFKHILNYTIGEFGLKLVSLLGLPLVASLLTVDEFGKTETAASIISICSILIVLGLDTALKRIYFDKDINYSSFIKFALRFYFVLSLIFLVLLGIINLFFLILKIKFDFGLLLLNITILASIFIGFKSIYISDLQIKRKSIKVSLINLIDAISNLIFSIVFLKLISPSAEMRLFVILLISIILFTYYISSLNKVRKEANEKIFYRKYLKYIVVYGMPITINQIAGFALGFIDRFMIIAFFGFTDTGLYSYAYKIGMVVIVFTTIVSQTMLPEFFERLNANDINRVKSLIREFSSYGIEATAVLMLLHKEIVLLLTPSSYVSSTYIVFIIFLGYLCTYLYNFYTQIEYYYKKTKIITIVSFSGAVINIILNLILMHFFGYEVAAITTFISFTFIYIAHYLYCRRRLSFNVFGIDKLGWIFLALTVIPFIMEMLKISNTIVLIGKGLILLLMVFLSRAIKTFIHSLKDRLIDKKAKSE